MRNKEIIERRLVMVDEMIVLSLEETNRLAGVRASPRDHRNFEAELEGLYRLAQQRVILAWVLHQPGASGDLSDCTGG